MQRGAHRSRHIEISRGTPTLGLLDGLWKRPPVAQNILLYPRRTHTSVKGHMITTRDATCIRNGALLSMTGIGPFGGEKLRTHQALPHFNFFGVTKSDVAFEDITSTNAARH